MAKKSLKLSKNAIMLMCSIILITLVVLVFIILKYDDRQIEKPEVKSEQLSSLVVENQVLKVELVDVISNKNYHKGYQEVTMDIQKDEEILGYKIDKKQSFEKIMQLLPPNDQSPLLNNSSEKPTHEAYEMCIRDRIICISYTNMNILSFFNWIKTFFNIFLNCLNHYFCCFR